MTRDYPILYKVVHAQSCIILFLFIAYSPSDLVEDQHEISVG